MPSKTEIVNLALGHLAVAKTIGNLETEKSVEALVGRRFYDIVLNVLLREYPWPFVTRIAALALVAVEPNTEWAFSYRYPIDCLSVRRILSGLRNDTRQTRAPYRMANDAEGTLIFTDEADAQMEYTVVFDNPLLFPSDFTMAFSCLLAVYMAPTVMASDQFKLGARAAELYKYWVSKAAATAFNEEQAEEPPDAESILAR